MHSQKSKLQKCDSNEIKTSILEEKVFKLFEDVVSNPDLLKQYMEVLRSEGKASQLRLQRQLKKLEDKIKSLGNAKKRVLELYASGSLDRAEYAKRGTEYDNEISQIASEKFELVKQIPLLHKPTIIELNIAQYCDEVRVRLKQCKDFETYRQFFLDFVDHVVYYKNLVELHGYVPIKSINSDGEQVETRLEYKVTTEIEWAERMAQYWKKSGGTRISLMDFNEVSGKSRKMMRDSKIQPKKSMGQG